MKRHLKISVAFLFSALFALSDLPAQSIIRAPYYESHVDPTSISISFQTTFSNPATIWFGPLSGYDQKIVSVSSINHSAFVDHLIPATQYLAMIVSGVDTVRFVTSTSSFNRSVDTTQGIAPRANGNVNYLSVLREKILHAHRSIDLALYSFGGVTADSVLVWLLEAHSRGVAVRVIGDSIAVHSSKQFQSLNPLGIPAIINSFGANWKTASNIHHNKFIVIDGRGDDGLNAWVLTGSWNLTDQQTTTDYQNIIYFQDLALARGFEAEFDQEWGSTTNLPDARYARFSTNKLDVTPRTYSVNGTTVRLFFSPNRGAAFAINARIAAANRQILFALFLFTRQDLAATMIARHQSGIDIHGVVNDNDKYEQTPALRAAGIDALDFTGPATILLHDKYAVVDAGTGNGAVITGSFNWSTNAEQANNENLIIVENDTIAKLYYQDWLARYHENGGNQTITIPQSEVSLSSVVALNAVVYPNPGQSAVHLEWMQERSSMDRLVIYTSTGTAISASEIYRHAGNATFTSPLMQHSGVYSIAIEHDGRKELRKFVLVR
jgi:phosphatidylserine/phosphatidylglycerophosphate/cardiolipin synthase-like enzyme